MTTIAPQPDSSLVPETPAARSRHVWSIGDYARIAERENGVSRSRG